MISCQDCELYRADASGLARFACSPFGVVKEPECLGKWTVIQAEQHGSQLRELLAMQARQLAELVAIRRAYEATLDHYNRLAPMQEKMMKHMERELDDIDEADSWKRSLDEDDDPPR